MHDLEQRRTRKLSLRARVAPAPEKEAVAREGTGGDEVENALPFRRAADEAILQRRSDFH